MIILNLFLEMFQIPHMGTPKDHLLEVQSSFLNRNEKDVVAQYKVSSFRYVDLI